DHMPGEDGCTLKGSDRATIYTVTNYVCTNIYDGTETGGGGEYYGSGGGTDSGTGGEPLGPGTTEPCNGSGVATNPLEPSTNISEGGCSGIPTVVTVPSKNKTPCQKIKQWFEDAAFKEKYDSITKPGIHQLNRERAFYMRYPTVGTNIPPAYVEVNMPTCSTDGNLPTFTEGMGGLMHTHNDLDCHGNTPIKIPSPTDIRTFFNTIMPEAGQYAGGYHNAYSIISTSGGNYMLMYSGTNYPGSINYDANKKLTKEYADAFEDLYTYNENVTQADIEKVFTKFMKEKINKPGFEIYKVTPTSAIKLEYDPNSSGSVKRTNCP
ncbi:hypothetical protein, partial [Chryseobacterium aquaticum]|uniref:hypothetical protein n=1 Tax=Chryseobacterium aquaticum TaxID=452084 RepID=UPI002FCA3960